MEFSVKDFYSKYEQICNFFGGKLVFFLCSDFLCSVVLPLSSAVRTLRGLWKPTHEGKISDFVMPWCRGYRYWTTLFNKAWNQVLRCFKSCPKRVGDKQLWESLTTVLAGNKAKRLLSVNHTTITIYQGY